MANTTLTGRYEFEFDPYIKNPENRIPKERHVVSSAAGDDQHFLVPKKAPFFAGDTLKVVDVDSGQPLRPGIDFKVGWYYAALSLDVNLLNTDNELYWAICIVNKDYLDKVLEVDYHTIGDMYVLDSTALATFLRNNQIDPIVTTWDSVKNKPAQYASDPHLQSIDDFIGWDQVVAILNKMLEKNTSLFEDFTALLRAHTLDESNPHKNTLLTLGISRFKDVYASSKDQIIAGTNDKNFITPKALTEALMQLGILNSQSTVALQGPTTASKGADVEWTVTNYDSFSTYTVACDHGNFRIANGKMTGKVSTTAPTGNIEIKIDVSGSVRKINLRIT